MMIVNQTIVVATQARTRITNREIVITCIAWFSVDSVSMQRLYDYDTFAQG